MCRVYIRRSRCARVDHPAETEREWCLLWRSSYCPSRTVTEAPAATVTALGRRIAQGQQVWSCGLEGGPHVFEKIYYDLCPICLWRVHGAGAQQERIVWDEMAILRAFGIEESQPYEVHRFEVGWVAGTLSADGDCAAWNGRIQGPGVEMGF